MVSAADFTSVDALLALLSIIIGLTIFLMQRRADSKISRIIETQFKRQELLKKYFGTRLINNVQLVEKNHLRLVQYLSEYVAKRSKPGMNKAMNFSVFQSTNLQDYIVPSLRSDLSHLIEFVDDPTLVDQLSTAFDDFDVPYKDCSVESFYDELDAVITERAESTKKQVEAMSSLLARFEVEIQKTI